MNDTDKHNQTAGAKGATDNEEFFDLDFGPDFTPIEPGNVFGISKDVLSPVDEAFVNLPKPPEEVAETEKWVSLAKVHNSLEPLRSLVAPEKKRNRNKTKHILLVSLLRLTRQKPA